MLHKKDEEMKKLMLTIAGIQQLFQSPEEMRNNPDKIHLVIPYQLFSRAFQSPLLDPDLLHGRTLPHALETQKTAVRNQGEDYSWADHEAYLSRIASFLVSLLPSFSPNPIEAYYKDSVTMALEFVQLMHTGYF